MPTNLNVPPLGESVSEGVIIKWLKNDGEAVANGEPVVELETDKTNVDLPAPSAGVLRQTKKVGETVKIGETIARIDEGGAGAGAATATATIAKATTASASAPAVGKPVQPVPPAIGAPAEIVAASGRVQSKPEDLAPSVRRVVEEQSVDPTSVAGTGRGGRVTKEDVVRQVESRGAAPAASARDENGQSAKPSAPPDVRPAASTIPTPLPPAAGAVDTVAFDAEGIKRVPMSKIRKRIAENLIRAQQTAAILTTFNEIDMSNIMAIRTKYKDRFQEVHGVGLGFMSFFARAVVLALREFGRVNAFLEGDDVVYHNYVHLGVAVSTDRGLTVPVLKHAEQMSFAKIESEIKRVAGAARDAKLGIEELSGGTFTITNGGIFGSLLSTPILNPPQSGILGMHNIVKRPVAVGDKVEIHPMMYVALSYDHRIVDGRESVSFLVRLKEYLEDPARLMLEI